MMERSQDKIRENKREYSIDYDKLMGRGSAFIVAPASKGTVFSREDFSEEQTMFKNAAHDFGVKRMIPIHKELNKYNGELTREVFREMGELGFLGVDTPEEFGGLGLDKTTACIVVDALSVGRSPSMMVTSSAHTGISILPIIWYGNKQQKLKYLPKLSSGEWMGCYALTEPSAGSDAMAGTTTAKLSDDKKHYLLNGQKIFITNGAWADVCVTFAKVDGKYTAFIIDKECDGWVKGEEEKKLGIKGSSTVSMYFENCKVPVENVLGEVGEGGAVALNVLYTGRYKLGVTTASGAKNVINFAYQFAKEREQFSRSILEFGMIQRKFANMVARVWEADNINYMPSGSIDLSIESIKSSDKDYYVHVQKIIEDHSVEASLSKIIGSEALAFAVDEGVQIMGGAGFIEEYEMAGLYRDERINRIFEGTNEINRLIASSMTLKKAILEEMPIRAMIYERSDNWITDIPDLEDRRVVRLLEVLEFSRSLTLFTLNNLILEYGQDLKNKQWLLEPYADILASLAIMDTGMKRFMKIEDETKKENTFEVLNLSFCQHYNKMLNNAIKINLHLSQNHLKVIEKWKEKLNYKPMEIDSEIAVARTLIKNECYYLD